MITTLFTKSMLRFISVFLVTVIITEFFVPVSVYALTSGPTQPEFSSFEPVATTNMVNEFTGGFTYNLPVVEIPGPHGSSYPLSLSYHSGSTPEEEASWVGYGWNINPGAINRGVRGYPDDDLGVEINKYMNTGTNITATAGANLGMEVISTKVGIGAHLSIRFNNYKGFGYGVGIDANFAGMVSVGFNVEDGNSSFTAGVDPLKIMDYVKETKKDASTEVKVVTNGETTKALTETEKKAKQDKETKDKFDKKNADRRDNNKYENRMSSAFSYASALLSSPSYAVPMQEFEGMNIHASLGITASFSLAPIPAIGGNVGFNGSYSSHKTKDKVLEAYGYMYSGIAQMERLKTDDNKVSMDYYKERNAPYQAHQKYMPIPFNNPDVYSVSGEGVGGNFRFHHREIGDNLPEISKSRKSEIGLSLELTAALEWGASPYLNLGSTTSELSATLDNDHVRKYSTDAPFRDFKLPADGDQISGGAFSLNKKDEGVFPRFDGDLGGFVVYDQDLNTLTTSVDYDKIRTPGDFNSSRVMNVNGTAGGQRSGRSSNISYNTIGTLRKNRKFCYTKDNETRAMFMLESTALPDLTSLPDGTDMTEYIKNERKLKYLPDNAIGEFAVYLPDGKCYVYGLPVLARKDVRKNQIVGGKYIDARSTGEERQVPYATKYLLTQILLPDYVDLTGNGPTDDDLGGWTKLSYRRCKNSSTEDWAKWRVPFREFIKDQGKIIDEKDDSKSYSEGEKQLYVLDQIETASHAAIFITNKTKDKLIPGTSTYISGSQVQRADAFQYGFANGTNMAFMGKWPSTWPTSVSPGNVSNGDNQYSHVEPASTNNPVADLANTKYQNGYKLDPSMFADEETPPDPAPYPNFSENLERIELYKKGDDVPIKTVVLEYDYSIFEQDNGPWTINCGTYVHPLFSIDDKGKIVPNPNPNPCIHDPTAVIKTFSLPYWGLPNSAMFPTKRYVWDAPNTTTTPFLTDIINVCKYGKLTLKKVWFEYGNVQNAKISPYQFEYNYPIVSETEVSFSADLDGKYPDIANYGSGYDYGTHGLVGYTDQAEDPWGYYSDAPWELAKRNREGQRWLKQKPNNMDPALYQLKVIKLPSGGEIRVQYEGHDYSYVQNRPVMGMVSFTQNTNDFTKFYLNTDEDLGITDSDELDILAKKINKRFLGKEKIAFKFLCGFGSSQPNANTSDYSSLAQPEREREYIQGYLDLAAAGVDGTGLYIQIGSNATSAQKIVKKLAEEYYQTNISGNTSSADQGGIVENIKALTHPGNFTFLNSVPPLDKIFNKFSYLRIPLPNAKKAGGCRVKRVLMYDPGDDLPGEDNEGGAGLYGQEYIYQTSITSPETNEKVIISSGVATNEPPQIRVENSLINFMEGYDTPSWSEKPIAGKNIDQYEGPLGESLLPGPSIGYSKIIVRNIHAGKTTPGFMVNEYYTYKDFPFINDTQFSGLESVMDQLPVHIPLPFLSLDVFDEIKSQGYCFSINTMHGQPKSKSQYKWELGTDVDVLDMLDIQKSPPVETIEYEYFKPKELIPVFVDESTVLKKSLIGVEMEVSNESSSFSEQRNSLGIEIDFGLGYVGIIVLPYFSGGLPNIGMSDIGLECSAISKVITYPSILKKTVTKRDGMLHTVENIAFSPYTGQTVVKMVTDEFDGTVPDGGSALTGTTTLYEIPAALKYGLMGQKAENDRYSLMNEPGVGLFAIQTTSTTGVYKLVVQDWPPYVPSAPPLYPGDVIMFSKTSSSDYLGSMIVESNVTTATSGEYECLVRPSKKNSGAITSPDKMVLVRSGRTNQLSAIAGTIALYGKTRDAVLTTSLATLSASGVLSASATKYSDDWDYSWAWSSTGSTTSSDTSYYELGRRGKWRPFETYTFRDETVGGTSTRVYADNGTLLNAFVPFDWSLSTTPWYQWIKTNTITHYSKHGEPVEEADINDIHSSARFAHKEAVPSIIATNAKYLNLYFESYEDQSGSGVSDAKSHTGLKSKSVASSGSVTIPALKDAGDYIIKLWSTCGETTPPAIGGTNMNVVCRSGEWVLYEATRSLSTSSTTISFSSACYVDDIRVQPKESQSTCYVYNDKNLRLLAQFDDQHFASIFQYNDEGKLIRKIKETARGVKTVAETDYNTPTILRTEGTKRGIARYSAGLNSASGTGGAGAVSSSKSNETQNALKKGIQDIIEQNGKEKINGTLQNRSNNAKGVIERNAKTKANDMLQNTSKDVRQLPTVYDRVKAMYNRKSKGSVDTAAQMKFDLLNIHATPEKMNAKIIGVDSIKIDNSNSIEKKDK